jgi:hypothetical protein
MFIRLLTLYCDRPNCPRKGEEAMSGDNQFQTIDSYKKAMRKEGWIFKNKKAYCAECLAAIEATRKDVKNGYKWDD